MALRENSPIFWERPDIQKTYVAVSVTDATAITISNLTLQHNKTTDGFRVVGNYGGDYIIPEGMENEFTNAMDRVLQTIKKTHPNVDSLIIYYNYRDQEKKVYSFR